MERERDGRKRRGKEERKVARRVRGKESCT